MNFILKIAFLFAAVVAPTASLHTIVASQIPGVVLDCNLTTKLTAASGACTNNTVAINAALATASAASPLKLILDGVAGEAGLQIATCGYTEIAGMGWSTGLVTLSNSDASAISNGWASSSQHFRFPLEIVGGTVPTIGNCGNVYIHDLKINENRSTYVSPGNASNGVTSGNLAYSGAASYGYNNGAAPNQVLFSVIDLWNLNNIRIDNIWAYDSAGFTFVFSNANGINITNCRFEPASYIYQNFQDGVHLDGNTSNIFIRGNYFVNLGDDPIAANAPEGYSGNIGDITITDNHMVNTIDCFRMYAQSAGNGTSWYAGIPASGVGNVVFANNVCAATTEGFLLGNPGNLNSADQFLSFHSTGNTISAPGLYGIGANIRDFVGADSWTPTASAPMVYYFQAATISSMNLSTTINRTANFFNPIIAMTNSSIIGRLKINSLAVEDPYGSAYTAFPQIISMGAGSVIGEVNFANAINTTNITANVDVWTGISAVSGFLPLPSTVATLPTTALEGTQAKVTDLTSPTFLGTAAGSGAVHGLVYRNATAWVVQ